MKKPNREISALYLELASDCCAKAATVEDRVTAEGLRLSVMRSADPVGFRRNESSEMMAGRTAG
jgi:hypothetical protein